MSSDWPKFSSPEAAQLVKGLNDISPQALGELGQWFLQNFPPKPIQQMVGYGKINGIWQSYTPVWTSTGTAPALGNGTLVGRYAQVGKIVAGRVLLTAGSSTTFGTGSFAFSLPVTAASGETAQVFSPGQAVGVDTGVLIYPGLALLNTSTTVNLYTTAGAAFSATVPFTFGNTDTISFRFTYEAA